MILSRMLSPLARFPQDVFHDEQSVQLKFLFFPQLIVYPTTCSPPLTKSSLHVRVEVAPMSHWKFQLCKHPGIIVIFSLDNTPGSYLCENLSLFLLKSHLWRWPLISKLANPVELPRYTASLPFFHDLLNARKKTLRLMCSFFWVIVGRN